MYFVFVSKMHLYWINIIHSHMLFYFSCTNFIGKHIVCVCGVLEKYSNWLFNFGSRMRFWIYTGPAQNCGMGARIK